MTPPLALVAPTASGKTEASLPIAEALGAEIVCVDSMLVYRGMDVGTAKPADEERARVPHHLLDVADPSEAFSVVRYQRLARGVLRHLEERARIALLVGGTGLYYRAVVDDLAFPGTEARTRRLLETEVAVVGPQAMHARLAAFDPAAADRMEPANARRIVRALEVAAVSGRRFSDFAEAWDRYPPGTTIAAGVEIGRPALHRRIEHRVMAMMSGLLAETARLAQRGFAGFLTSTQAIGYAEAVSCLEGWISEDEAAAKTISRTKALARRQLAWFRRDPRIRWFPAGAGGAAEVVDELLAFYRRAARRPAEAAMEA